MLTLNIKGLYDTYSSGPSQRRKTGFSRYSTGNETGNETGNDEYRRRLAYALMRIRIFVEPQQGASYEQLLAVAKVTEECGFDALFRSDHFVTMGGSGLPGPTDAWITLAGLARETSRIRLGTLMTSATFRRPGPLAIAVAQVDAMSAGRVELGIGAGWYEAEHQAYGIPFPNLKDRFDILEEQLEIISGLWKTPMGSTYSFAGSHFNLKDSPALPKPTQSPTPPIIVGGKGKSRTPQLAARYANEFNTPFLSVSDAGEQYLRVEKACESIGRDPSDIGLSATLIVCCGANPAEFTRRANSLGRQEDELRVNGAAGSPQEVAEKISSYRAAGASTIYLQVLDLGDLDHLRLISSEVAPLLK